MMAATARYIENFLRGWWVIPDEMVIAVRPPGMNRAVISNMPPRLSSCVAAQARRFSPLSPRKRIRFMNGPYDAPNW